MRMLYGIWSGLTSTSGFTSDTVALFMGDGQLIAINLDFDEFYKDINHRRR